MPGADEFINPVLQGLCADALIAVSDEDADWELTFHEFMKCLDPGTIIISFPERDLIILYF